MTPRASISESAMRRGMPAMRPLAPGVHRKSRPSFDLVVAFAILGVALLSAVALIGGLAYRLPAVISLMLWAIPLLAMLLVGFAVFVRERR